MTLKVTSNGTSVLCRKERWKEEDGIRLLIPERVNDKEQLPTTINFRYIEKYWDQEGIHEDRLEVGV